MAKSTKWTTKERKTSDQEHRLMTLSGTMILQNCARIVKTLLSCFIPEIVVLLLFMYVDEFSALFKFS